jgi:hypothetical protein
VCRLYLPAEYGRIALSWAKLLEPAHGQPPEFVTVQLPDATADPQIRVHPEHGVTTVLGSDYTGEAKKSFLRLFMHRAKRQGGLGLHAGSKRVTLAEAPGARTFSAMGQSSRRVLGVGFAQRGSMRDTAGLLITSLTDGGAAEKAGLMEGDRVVSVDGIDLRVPAADAGSPDGVEARISRLRRALDAARDSQPVRLEVLSEGRRRTLSVTPARETGWSGWNVSPGQWQGMAADIRASVNRNMTLSDDDRREIERARSEAVREGQGARAEGMRAREEGMRARERAMRERSNDSDDDDMAESDGRSERRDDRRGGMLRGRTDGATLSLDGLSLASVDRDFGQQFGRGAERGALVVRTRDSWEPLRAGDVILTIEGRAVRDGNALDVTIDRSKDQRVTILRNGRQQTITLRPSR